MFPTLQRRPRLQKYQKSASSSDSPPTTTSTTVSGICNLRNMNKITLHVVISAILTVAVLVLSIGITSHLILGDVDDHVELVNGPLQQISLIADFLDIDALMRTVTVDWFVLPFNCSDPEMVVNLFTDPNLMTAGAGNSADTASASAPTDPIFQINSTEYCHATNRDSFPVFRTVLKLTGLASLRKIPGFANRRSLQAYPFDLYFFQASMFAQLADTNQSAGIVLAKSFGTPINFDVRLNSTGSQNNEHGFLLQFNVSRSAAVISLVVIIVIANWLVTIAFLWITVAAFIWDHEIVAEMFVLPIATLFAFTSVRGSLPGAPTGFGAVVDYYGILPNLGLITLFSAVLLIRVLYRRVSEAAKRKRKPAPQTTDTENLPMSDLVTTGEERIDGGGSGKLEQSPSGSTISDSKLSPPGFPKPLVPTASLQVPTGATTITHRPPFNRGATSITAVETEPK
ncbi:hypothetical protein R3P38DRAFT_2696005 [Favolaschia claudopus]|uniref:Transmembrane protein n=1 Tax=Favolaschia claudopus TaxID=2862362 RepID=A0AAW0CM46_9AGAR